MVVIDEFKDEDFELYYGFRPCEGEVYSGDSIAVAVTKSGVVLAMIDGLGHGKEASDVSSGMQAYIEEHHERPLKELLELMHQHFKGSRGAVIGVARVLRDGSAQYIGLGNITSKIVRTTGNTPLLSKDGVLGMRSRKFEVVNWKLEKGEVLIMHSDGIRRNLWNDRSFRIPFLGSSNLINNILKRYGRSHDDAAIIYLNRIYG